MTEKEFTAEQLSLARIIAASFESIPAYKRPSFALMIDCMLLGIRLSAKPTKEELK